MRETPPVTTEAIQSHYDRLSVLYRTFWGNHIHHGFWDAEYSPKEAQIALIRTLAAKAHIQTGFHVLDVGCGLGGSSIWLARYLECSVVGLTISPVQQKIATRRAARQRLGRRVVFRVEDANSLQYESVFDCVWVIECSEHLFDKAGFVRRAAAALKPGGRFALCAWLKGDGAGDDSKNDLVQRVCRSMLCPSLGSKQDYCEWMTSAGLEVQTADDVTDRVARTWDLCRKITQKPIIRQIMKNAGSDTLAFVNSFNDIAVAYAEGAMAYGMFTAVKLTARNA